MEENEKKKVCKHKTCGRSITDYFKRAVGYYYQQVVSESIKVPATKLESKKVTNMVGTFLTNNSNGINVSATKMASKKVTNMVGTFLNDDVLFHSYVKLKMLNKYIIKTFTV